MNFKYHNANFKLLLAVLMGIVMSSCSIMNGDKEPLLRLTDLQGLWLENGTEHYVRFTEEQSDEEGFLYGREWDEDDWFETEMTYEEYLIWNREKLGHPGNGWFKYKFETTDGGLTEIHLMDNEGAEIPMVYIVSKLTDTELEYYEKEYTNFKYAFSRVVETRDVED